MPLLQRKTVTLGLTAILIWFGCKAIQIHEQRGETTNQVKDLEFRIGDLERNNQFLASSSAYFASNAYLERQARLKLNYKLPDEQVAFVYKDTSLKTTPAAEAFKNTLAAMPNWKKWWYYLLGY